MSAHVSGTSSKPTREPLGDRGLFCVDNTSNTSYDNHMKILFYTFMRGFYTLWTVPEKWLYWDEKLLKAREDKA